MIDGALCSAITHPASEEGEFGRTALPYVRKYPQELRDRAVRLVLESDRPIAQIA
jgi:hypothetical protein